MYNKSFLTPLHMIFVLLFSSKKKTFFLTISGIYLFKQFKVINNKNILINILLQQNWNFLEHGARPITSLGNSTSGIVITWHWALWG